MKLDNFVTWTSQAGGRTKTKTGRIVEVVPSGGLPSRRFTQLHRGSGIGMARDHESYVVLVGNKHYWPRASLLRSATPRRAPEAFREAVHAHFPAVDPDWMWKTFAPYFSGEFRE